MPFQNTILAIFIKKAEHKIKPIKSIIVLIVFFLFPSAHSQCNVQTVNADFEYPPNPSGITYLSDNYNPAQLGWKTTASNHIIEYWSGGAYSGNQFIELNATEVSGLYQDYNTSIATYFNFSFAHKGRSGIDSMVLKAGPPGGPYSIVMTASTDKNAWKLYTGTYKVPAGQTTTRFIFEALTTASGSPTVGNFLDAINFTATIDSPSLLDVTPDSTPNTYQKTICAGTSTTLTALGISNAIFNWYNSANVLIYQGSTFTTPVLNGNATYKIKQTNSFGCESNYSIVNIKTMPKPSKIKTSKTICSGETFTWSENNVTYNTAGTYLVPKDGCTADQELILAVTPKPAKITTLKTICSGETFTWSESNITYNTAGTYLVPKDGCTADQELILAVTPKPAKVTTSKTICSGETFTWGENNVTYNTAGTYLVPKDGCTADQELILAVTPKPAKITTSKTICSGETFTWSENNVTYNTAGTYLVPKDGCTADQELVLTITPKPAKVTTSKTICSGETFTWSENNVTYNTAGTYLVPKDGCTADQELILAVTPKPAKITTPKTICSGETFTWGENNVTHNTAGTYLVTKDGCTADQELILAVTPKPAKVTTPKTICSGETFTWSENNVTYNTAGTYLVTKDGCTADQELILAVTPKPAKVTTPKTICSGETFTWSENNVTYNTAGTYLVPKDGCTADQELILAVTPKPAKITTPKTICSDETFTWSENNVTYNTTGTYLVPKDGCTADQELILAVTPKPAKVTTPKTICSGETFTWSENNVTYNTAGTYLVPKDGCTADQELILEVVPTLTSTLIENSLLAENCFDDKNGAFSIEIKGGAAPYKLSLDKINGTYEEISGNVHTYENLTGGLHTVYIKDARNCTNQLDVEIPNGVTINPIAHINYECLNNLPVNSVTVTIDPSITNPTDVDYTIDGDPNGYQSNRVFTNVLTGTHTITARHSNGCTQTTKPFIIDSINPLELSLNNGAINEIIAIATGGAGNYQYTFNTESTGSDNKLIIYKSGNYNVTVTDKNGCRTSISKYFEYIDIAIPNYFTPDGDGINDLWGPESTLQYQNLTFTIFDRYGRIINKFSNGQKWDGKYNGTELTSGDYWYVLKLNDPKDPREFTGHVTLYR